MSAQDGGQRQALASRSSQPCRRPAWAAPPTQETRLAFVQLLISGISLGCIYALIALGFVLIYKATETVNFAQGELMMLGAFGGLLLMTVMGLPFWLAAPLAVACMFGLGMGLERAVIRPILGQPQFTVVMLTIGVGYTARGLVSMIPEIGTETHTLAVPYKVRVHQLRA